MTTDFDSLFTLEELVKRFLKNRTRKSSYSLTNQKGDYFGMEHYHHPFEIIFKYRKVKDFGTQDAVVDQTQTIKKLYLVNSNSVRGKIKLQDENHVKGIVNGQLNELSPYTQYAISQTDVSELKTIKDRLEFCEWILEFGTPTDCIIDDIDEGGFQEPITRWDVRRQLEKESVS